ncbi:four-carbon acid sugar kinase family protein, partial [Paenibacillus sepulcri]|nr:four-carbon acid sugar kinase family protein [Paenibacillus sepulcri]
MIGVVADDITGAGDIGIMFAKSGLRADVYAYDAAGLQPEAEADVYIIDTDSRFDERDAAYAKVKLATAQLQALGCTAFFNKTCSVFRGNIGGEFDAMLDALEADFAVVVLGFPKNGRTTLGGIHYVNGMKLEESHFRHDPVHPMLESDLVSILQSQTKRRVSLIDFEIIGQGAEALREEIGRRRAAGGYVILDVAEQRMLAVIAEAIRDERIICGASAIAEELALLMKERESGGADLLPVPYRPDLGILIAAGSLTPQTAAQVEAYLSSGRPAFRLDPEQLLEEGGRPEETGRLSDAIERTILSGEDVLLYSENRPGKVAHA